ncbi:MAG: hypothetical protein NVSMB42_04240 [Herpetosiphon sp.]
MLDVDAELMQWIEHVAECRGRDQAAVVHALLNEDAVTLSQLLGSPPQALDEQLSELRRALNADGDWGAGCVVLSDELRRQVKTVIQRLLTDTHGDYVR